MDEDFVSFCWLQTLCPFVGIMATRGGTWGLVCFCAFVFETGSFCISGTHDPPASDFWVYSFSFFFLHLLLCFHPPLFLRQCLTVPQPSLKLLLRLSFPSAEVLGIAATSSLTKQGFYLFSFFFLFFPCGLYWSDLAPLDWPSDCFHSFIFLFKYIPPFLALHWILKNCKIYFLTPETESYYVNWTGTCYIDQTGLGLSEIILPLLPKCWH